MSGFIPLSKLPDGITDADLQVVLPPAFTDQGGSIRIRFGLFWAPPIDDEPELPPELVLHITQWLRGFVIASLVVIGRPGWKEILQQVAQRDAEALLECP